MYTHGSFRKLLTETIHESQKCQRNWNLDDEINSDDLEIIIDSATNCPSKQNLNYYKLHVIKDRELIEELHQYTKGFGPIYDDYDSETPNKWASTGHYSIEKGNSGKFYTNPQVKANILLVFTKNHPEQIREENEQYEEDRQMAVGIAAGYVNIISTMLGYATGCNKCFSYDLVKDALGNDEEPILMMGIGIPDKTRDRREHHDDPNFKFPSLRKLKNIPIIYHE